jgi:dienelactone hydrolase
MRALALGLLLGALAGPSAACGAPLQSPEESATALGRTVVREEQYSVSVIDAGGHTLYLKARICRPLGDAPSRLVSINHGTSKTNTDRPAMKLGDCRNSAAQWFVTRGFVVAFALRRGYGETGGAWAEDTGGCNRPDFYRAGLETARDIDAVINFATGLRYVRRDGVVVVGQSAGGWGAIAYNSMPHPKVGAFVVMAGGRGGHRHDEPNQNCNPELLIETSGRFGRTATTPMLWIYTENDSYFDPSLARALWHAFEGAGGQADLHQLGPFGADGHHLFFDPTGYTVWGPLVERYLADTPG